MGFGEYSRAAHEALLDKRSGSAPEAVFRQTSCHPLMNPKGVKLRESRDSADHPQSLAIAFALDVTGSMGGIPRQLALQTLPKFMSVLEACGVKDPQVLFCAVGDATSDNAPLQIGQFESTAELMDQWLTWSYLEGGGGGMGSESYELALYFLALHTAMDCLEKRKQRGYLFMTGDELPYPILSRHIVESVIGDRLDEDLKTEEVVAELQNHYVPFFLVPDQARRARCERTWRKLLGEHVLCLDAPEDVCFASAGAIALDQRLVPDLDALGRTLEHAGATAQQRKRTLRALLPLAVAPRAGGAAPGAPSPLKRLFKRP